MVTTRQAILCAVILMAGSATERWVQDGKNPDDVAAALGTEKGAREQKKVPGYFVCGEIASALISKT